MAVTQQRFFSGVAPFLKPILPNGFKQAIPHRAILLTHDNERLPNKIAEVAQNLGRLDGSASADTFRRFERPAAREDRQPS